MFTRKRNSVKEVSEIKGNWDTIGLELLHQKYKHDFTPSEKNIIKDMLREGPPPLQYRQKLWLISSGAAREINNNPGYYKKLLEYSKIIPCPSENQIKLDLRRTFPEEKECMTETFLERLKNILICYSTRNTSVGYCQGMNFIGGRILLVMGNEEQAFWIFIQVMEKILPIVYYSELVGIVMETTLVENLISLYFPDLYKFISDNNFNVPLRNFIHKWMVCLFTQTLSPEMVYSFLDYLFLEGSDFALIKNSLFIISFIHDKLLKSNDFEYMYNIFNEGTINIHDVKSMIYFLEDKKLEITPQHIKEFQSKMEKPIVSKFREESLASYDEKFAERKKSLKKKGIQCNPNWPTCYYDDYTQTIIEVLILKESKTPYIINDYYYIKNDGYPDDTFLGERGYNKGSSATIKEVLVERHKHVCDNAKLVDNSKILLDDEYKKIDFDLVNTEQNNSDENKIYDKLKNSKDFDIVVKEIKSEMEKIIKPMKINEFNTIIENNSKEEQYYPKDYIFHILQ
jgi:hypothetical protein